MQNAQRNIALHFNDLNLNPEILEAIEREGYTEPTDIQKQAIPVILEGQDVLGLAQTGTGKTAAFALPILHQLAEGKHSRRPRTLILSPTRELARQIAESFASYGKNLKLRGTVVYGGVPQRPQVRALKAGVDILIATPGRLLDLFDQGHVDLSEVETFVLDEADHMLDMGFIHPIRKIAAELPEQRQNLMFSATMPKSIQNLADSLLNDPVRVTAARVASTAPKIEQHLYFVDQTSKPELLNHILKKTEVDRAIVFTRTKHGADRVAKNLGRSKIRAEVIHGNKSQNARRRALSNFKGGSCHVLVATDVAARGIDVDGITHVVNYNIPNEPESYVHRIGRTGRAGATGIALSFCDRSERRFLRNIERLTKKRMEVQEPEDFDAPTFDKEKEQEQNDSSVKAKKDSSRSSNKTFDSNREETRFHAKRKPGHKKGHRGQRDLSTSKRESETNQSEYFAQGEEKPKRNRKNPRKKTAGSFWNEPNANQNTNRFAKKKPSASKSKTSGSAKDNGDSFKRGPKSSTASKRFSKKIKDAATSGQPNRKRPSRPKRRKIVQMA